MLCGTVRAVAVLTTELSTVLHKYAPYPIFVCREVSVSLSVVLLTRLYRVIRSDAPTDGTESEMGGALGTEEDDGFYDAAALSTRGKNSKGKRGKGKHSKRDTENQRPPKRRPVTVAEQVRGRLDVWLRSALCCREVLGKLDALGALSTFPCA
jgi:hypothetical protein